MSSTIAPLTRVETLLPHPNADKLELAIVDGFQVCVGKGTFTPGDLAIYVPPQTTVPEAWADLWGVKPYLASGLRTKSIKLRGEPSHGFLVPLLGESCHVLRENPRAVGDNVADLFELTHYVKPEKPSAGDSSSEDPLFFRYTDIENMRHFPKLLVEGETVWVTEKLHGTNSRVGVVNGEPMAGSHRVQRKRPTEDSGEIVGYFNPGSSVYWSPWSLGPVQALLNAFAKQYRQVILFGEIVGASIQKLSYGYPPGVQGYRAFDLMLDGNYLDYGQFLSVCGAVGIETVPVLHKGPFDLDIIKELASGSTTLDAPHIREGVVVRPLRERIDPKTGRVILKWVSDDYLTGKYEED